VNAADILKYGHLDVQKSVENLADSAWEIPEVTTKWSVKDTVGHLAAYELLLRDAFRSVLGEKPTPYLDKTKIDHAGFNDSEAALRKSKTKEEIWKEYMDANAEVMKLFARFTPEKLREPGTIPWYGADYALDDFIVYANYAHKREHVGSIQIFRKKRGV
jgi:uncharacterized damage-inducible protein DinB